MAHICAHMAVLLFNATVDRSDMDLTLVKGILTVKHIGLPTLLCS